MSKHTPGPWHYRPYYRGGFQVIGDSGRAIPVEGYGDIDEDVKEANARLIAAAPDLLAACRSVLDDLVYLRHAESNGADDLRAAIAKATGEAS